MPHDKNHICWSPQAMSDENFPSRPALEINNFLKTGEVLKTLEDEQNGQKQNNDLDQFINEIIERSQKQFDASAQNAERLKRALKETLGAGGAEISAAVQLFKSSGLQQDMKIRLSDAALARFSDQAKYFCKAEPQLSLGGNPAISAERHAFLHSRGIPDVFFAGVMGKGTRAYCNRQKELADVFHEDHVFLSPVDYRTVAVSANTIKLMCNVDPGPASPLRYASDQWRNGMDLEHSEPTFDEIANQIVEKFYKRGHGTKILAIGGTSGATASEWQGFIKSVKKKFEKKFGEEKRPYIFISTSGFRRVDGSPDKFAKELFDQVIRDADIVSMSLDELEVLHRTTCGANPEITAALKLRQLPMNQAIKVAHSPSGAIADVLAVPGDLINHMEFTRDPGSRFIAECLRFAVDGATAALESPHGRRLTFDQIQGYSGSISDRQRQLAAFDVDFKHPGQIIELPAGMIGCASPYTRSAGIGSLVGLGAQFDALLFAFLMRSTAQAE